MPAPTHRQIRDAIEAVMNTVSGIGLVHDFERYADRKGELTDLYKSSGQIRGWFIRRVGRAEQQAALGRYVVDTRWQIRGYMSLDDDSASELAFDDLVDGIVDAFRADEDLAGVVATTITEQAAGAQLTDSGPVMFAGVLCHGARLSLTTRHYQ